MWSKLALSLLIVLCSSQAFAKCPSWLKKRADDLPLCPQTGLVPENYPIGAVVVSDEGTYGIDSGFTAEVVRKVLMGAEGKNSPLIILPVKKATLERIHDTIDSLDISRKEKRRFKKSLIHVPTTSYAWQQDYMQPFVDPQSGQINLRNIQNYKLEAEKYNFPEMFKATIDATEDCGIKAGTPLEGFPVVGGSSGGNIETLPGEICLLGSDKLDNNQWNNYAKQLCGNKTLKVDTSWLGVGHTDEILKVVRDNNKKAPCDFALSFASPKVAIDLLKKNPEGKFLSYPPSKTPFPVEEFVARISEHPGLNDMCRLYHQNKYRNQQKNSPSKSPSEGVSQFLKYLPSFINKAFASDYDDSFKELFLECANMTNEDAYKILTDKTNPISVTNVLIQDRMDLVKKDILSQLKKNLPQCEIKNVDVPNIFIGGIPVEIDGKMVLPDHMAVGILPNPTNAISINDTIITPDPSNVNFRDFIGEEYKKLGLKPQFVDTFAYAHINGGNLHCVTNTVHICKPRGKK